MANIPDDHLVDSDDTGWRKLGLTIAGLGIISWGYWITQFSVILQGLYTVYGGFVIAMVTMFMGLHIADKVQGGIINLKAYPLANGDAQQAPQPPPVAPIPPVPAPEPVSAAPTPPTAP